MNPLALEIPDDRSRWAIWLDRQVVGPNLRLLVRQWELLSGITAELRPGESWDQILETSFSNQLPDILSGGLTTLSMDDLQRLMRQPRLLLALQEQVFLRGGNYWETLARSEEHSQASDRCSSQVVAMLRNVAETNPDVLPSHTIETTGFGTANEYRSVAHKSSSPKTVSSRKALRTVMYLAALAASIVFAVFMIQPKSQPRFFDRAGLLVSSLEGQEFTQSLARAIREDWKPDSSDQEFLSQLRAVRDSCERLVAADLHQLPPAIGQDLKTRCRKWQASFSEMLDGLDTGRPVSEVRQEANQLVDRLVNVLSDLG